MSNVAIDKGSIDLRIWNSTLAQYVSLVYNYEVLSHTKVSNSTDWITTIQYSVDLTAGQYGAISSTTKKNWSLEIDGDRVASGTNTIGISANSSKTLASGTYSIRRDSVSASMNQYYYVKYNQEWDITFSGQSISSYQDEEHSGDVNMIIGAVSDPATFTRTDSNYSLTDVGNIEFDFNPGTGVQELYFYIAADQFGNSPLTSGVRVENINSGHYEAALSTTLQKQIREVWLKDKTKTTVYYILKSFFADESYLIDMAFCNVTLANTDMTLLADVYDINPKTVAATGNKYTFIRYMSNAEYTISATPVPAGADIVSCYVQNGTYKGEPPTGIINGVENGSFYFYAKDSRGVVKTQTIERTMLNYSKLTCHTVASTELSGDLATGAKVKLVISGNYFDGSFGAVSNELVIEIKHTQNDGSMGDWVVLTQGLIPDIRNGTYSLDMNITGLVYDRTYDFYCRVSDKLMSVEAEPFTLKVLPVFDWSEFDFNFNTPVNMFKNTVLRYNMDVHNTVLSGGSGGKIYLRPSGTDETDGEVILHSSGNVEVSGNLDVSGEIYKNGVPYTPPVDHIVERGTEAMGTNGTWYWEKWSSGKAVCWGTRNFGSTTLSNQVSTTCYTGVLWTQNFPSGLFKYAPDSVQMTLACMGQNTHGVILTARGADNHTASKTGGFNLMSTYNSATVTQSNISFYAIGRWK